MLQSGLGIVEGECITVTVVPTAKALIGYGQAARGVIVATADGSSHALIAVITVVKAAFTAQFQVDLGFRLAFFGDDINQAAGTAAAIQ
ncbi:hypothetical protein D3C71_1267330 [compost metagenome]